MFEIMDSVESISGSRLPRTEPHTTNTISALFWHIFNLWRYAEKAIPVMIPKLKCCFPVILSRHNNGINNICYYYYERKLYKTKTALYASFLQKKKKKVKWNVLRLFDAMRAAGIEPVTTWLKDMCSTNWAMHAIIHEKGGIPATISHRIRCYLLLSGAADTEQVVIWKK